MDVEERGLLFRALKEAGIFPNFMREVRRFAVREGKSPIGNIMESSFNYVIDNALYWAETDLGDDFWDDVDEIFRHAEGYSDHKKFITSLVGTVRSWQFRNKRTRIIAI